jgi:hypothetical protein
VTQQGSQDRGAASAGVVTDAKADSPCVLPPQRRQPQVMIFALANRASASITIVDIDNR